MKKFLSKSKFAGLALGLVALLAITTAAGVNGVFNSVNSALGYQVAGAAGISGQALCSDGTRYDTPCTPFSGTSRKNCLSVSCAGGSTYATATTYTNSLSVPVIEEVGMTGVGSCAGADSSLTYVVGGSAQGGNGIWNSCSGVAHVTFIVPPGVTFSATNNYIDGGGTQSITSWFETAL